RQVLPAPEPTHPGLAERWVTPRTPAEEALANIWAEVLGQEPVGIDENFFELGGDSIRSIQILSRAREKGLHFSLQQLLQYQTIRELAQELQMDKINSEVPPPSQPFSMISDTDRQRMPEDVEDAYPLSML